MTLDSVLPNIFIKINATDQTEADIKTHKCPTSIAIKLGFTTIAAPINPTIMATLLLIPIFSPKKIIASKVANNGAVKARDATSARGVILKA